MAKAGEVFVELKGKDRGFDKAFDRAEKRVGSFQKSIGGMATATKALLGTAAVAGTAALTRELFRMGSAALETENKFTTVFGSMSGDVEGFTKDFGRMAGLSEVAAKELTATTGAIVQGMGFARTASAEFSKQVLTLAGDLGSFNNLPTADVAFRIQSALTGERESMKRLGIVVTEVEVQQRALNNTGKTNVAMLTQQEKATATLEIITGKAGVAIGDLARTQNEAANTGKRVAAQIDDVKTTIAVGLLPALASLMTFLDQNLPAIERWADRVALAFQTAFDPSAIGLKGFEAELDRQMQQRGARFATQLLPTQENLESRRAEALADLRAAEAQLEGFSGFDKLLDTVGFKNLEADAAKSRIEIDRIDRAISILSGKMIGLEFPSGLAGALDDTGKESGEATAAIDHVAEALEKLEDGRRFITDMGAALEGTGHEFDFNTEAARLYETVVNDLIDAGVGLNQNLDETGTTLLGLTGEMAGYTDAVNRTNAAERALTEMLEERKKTLEELAERQREFQELVAETELQELIEEYDRVQAAANRMANSVGDALLDLSMGTQDAAAAVEEMVTEIIEQLMRLTLIDPIVSHLRGFFLGLLGGVNPLAGAAAGLPGVIAATPFAEGGRIKAGQLGIVGEKGPELFMPDVSGRILPEIHSGRLISARMGVDRDRSIADRVPDVVPGPRTARAGRPGNTLNMTVHTTIEALDSQSFERRLDQHSEAITGRVVETLRRSQGLRSVLDGR